MSDGRIIKGQSSATQLPDLEFIPNQGIRTIYRRKFTNYDDARNAAAALFSDKVRTSVRQDGDAPIWTVESSYEGDPTDPNSDLQNTHELRVNTLNPKATTSQVMKDRLQSYYGGNAARLAVTLEGWAEKIRDADDPYAVYDQTVEDMATTGPFISDVASAQELLDLFVYGTDDFFDFKYVYVHTFNFGTQRDLEIDNSNVLRIFTTAQMANAESIPANFGLPDGEWLKLPPEKITHVGNRAELKYEYWWAKTWSRWLYEEME